MNRIKQSIAALVLIACAPGAFAGIPVIDAAALAQAVQQVLAWGQQYTQMVQQIKQMKEQYDSMTGTRSLGTAVNNLSADSLVSSNMTSVLSGTTTAPSLVSTVSGMTNSALKGTQSRAQQIQQLMTMINSTSDAKGVAEIQARLEAETAAVANDANRLATLELQAKMDAERINNAVKAAHDANAVSVKRTTANFNNLYTMGK